MFVCVSNQPTHSIVLRHERKKKHNTQQTQNEQKKTNLPPCYCVSFDGAFFSFVSLASCNHSTKFVHVHVHAHVCTLLRTHMPFHSIPLDRIWLDWIELDFGLGWVNEQDFVVTWFGINSVWSLLLMVLLYELRAILFLDFSKFRMILIRICCFFNNFRLFQIKFPFFTFIHFYSFIYSHRHGFVAKIKLNEQCWHMSNPAQVHWKHLNRSEHTHYIADIIKNQLKIYCNLLKSLSFKGNRLQSQSNTEFRKSQFPFAEEKYGK